MLLKLCIIFLFSLFSTIGFSQESRALLVWGDVVVIKNKNSSFFVKVGQTISSINLTISKIERASPSTVIVSVVDHGILKDLKVSQDEVIKKESDILSGSSSSINLETSLPTNEQGDNVKVLENNDKKPKKNRSLQEWKILQGLEEDNILNISDLSEEEIDQVLLEATDCSYQSRMVLETCIMRQE
jgi:hypothetical protein